jgi:hypothetical protein
VNRRNKNRSRESNQRSTPQPTTAPPNPSGSHIPEPTPSLDAPLNQPRHKADFFVNLAIAIFTCVASAAAFWAAWEARQSRLEDQRPFLAVEAMQPNTNQPSRYIANRIWNRGKKSATRVSVSCVTEIDSTPPIQWSAAELTATFPYIVSENWVKISCPAKKDYAPPDNSDIVEMGFVEYRSPQNEVFRTPFCFTFKLIPNQELDIRQCPNQRGLPDID